MACPGKGWPSSPPLAESRLSLSCGRHSYISFPSTTTFSKADIKSTAKATQGEFAYILKLSRANFTGRLNSASSNSDSTSNCEHETVKTYGRRCMSPKTKILRPSRRLPAEVSCALRFCEGHSQRAGESCMVPGVIQTLLKQRGYTLSGANCVMSLRRSWLPLPGRDAAGCNGRRCTAT